MMMAITSAMTSGVVSCSKRFFTVSGSPSGVQIGNQLAFEPSDLVLEHELAFLQALYLQLIGLEVERQARNDLVEVPVRDPQLSQLFNILEKLTIDVVLIFDIVAHRSSTRGAG